MVAKVDICSDTWPLDGLGHSYELSHGQILDCTQMELWSSSHSYEFNSELVIELRLNSDWTQIELRLNSDWTQIELALRSKPQIEPRLNWCRPLIGLWLVGTSGIERGLNSDWTPMEGNQRGAVFHHRLWPEQPLWDYVRQMCVFVSRISLFRIGAAPPNWGDWGCGEGALGSIERTSSMLIGLPHDIFLLK